MKLLRSLFHGKNIFYFIHDTKKKFNFLQPTGDKKRLIFYHFKYQMPSNKVEQFNIHGSVHRKNILIYIQQDATLHSLFYLETALHVSGGTTTHHQERKQLYLQHLVFVTPVLLPAAIVEELEPG